MLRCVLIPLSIFSVENVNALSSFVRTFCSHESVDDVYDVLAGHGYHCCGDAPEGGLIQIWIHSLIKTLNVYGDCGSSRNVCPVCGYQLSAFDVNKLRVVCTFYEHSLAEETTRKKMTGTNPKVPVYVSIHVSISLETTSGLKEFIKCCTILWLLVYRLYKQ